MVNSILKYLCEVLILEALNTWIYRRGKCTYSLLRQCLYIRNMYVNHGISMVLNVL